MITRFKIYENINLDMNDILIIDSSGSFHYLLNHYLSEYNLYLAKTFTATFIEQYSKLSVFDNLNSINELKSISNRIQGGGEDGIQEAINHIIKYKLKGRVLIFSDGFFRADIRALPNNVAVLCTDDYKPEIKGNCPIFHQDLESLDYYYPPRDINRENYNFKLAQVKYNL